METINLIKQKESKEEFKNEVRLFLKGRYDFFGYMKKGITEKLRYNAEFKNPKDIKLKNYLGIIKSTTGDYTLNPETFSLEYEKLGDPYIFDPEKDKDFQEYRHNSFLERMKDDEDYYKVREEQGEIHYVMEYVFKKYSDMYHIPGLEYQKYLFDLSEKGDLDKIPEALKDSSTYYCLGSLTDEPGNNSEEGHWCAPAGSFGKGADRKERWYYSPSWIKGNFPTNGRVLLFKK